MSTARRIGLTAVATMLVALIALLWQIRPAFPAISTSLAAGHLDQALGFLGWLGILILAIGLLDRAARAGTRREQPEPLPLPSLTPSRKPARTPATLGGYSTTAFPLIPRARPLLDGTAVALEGLSLPSQTRIEAVADSPGGHGGPQAKKPLAAARADRQPSIALLGPIAITGSGAQGRRLRGATEQLLCYLALRPQGAHRDQLIDTLWGDQPTERLRERLWRTVADARGHLGETTIDRDGETYRLNRDQVRVDVDDLERLQNDSDRAAGARQRLTLLNRALELFRDDPLTGADYLWADGDVRRLTSTRVELLQQVGEARLEADDPTNALAAAEQGIAIDPGNENLARIAMRAEAAVGQRAAVVARYDRLTRTLDEQLGLRPSAETRALYLQLLSQDSSSTKAVGPGHALPPASVASGADANIGS